MSNDEDIKRLKRVLRDNIIKTTAEHRGEDSLTSLDKLYLKRIRLTLAKREAQEKVGEPFDVEISEIQTQIDLMEKLGSPSVLNDNFRKIG